MEAHTAALLGSLSTGILVGIASIVSARIGASSAVNVAKQRNQAEFLFTRRQKWLDELRELLSEFMSLGNWLHAQDDFTETVSNEKHLEKIQRISLLRHRIDLMLASHEPNHMELSTALKSAVTSALTDDSGSFNKAAGKIRDAGRAIAKETWDQAKGDIG